MRELWFYSILIYFYIDSTKVLSAAEATHLTYRIWKLFSNPKLKSNK